MSYSEYDFPHTHFYDTDLRELIHKISKILSTVESLDSWRTQHEDEYNELKALYDQIISGNFPDSMDEALKKWTVENSISIIGDLIKSLFVNLNDEGYIVFYIPDSWDDIVFGTTGLDTFPAGIDYGHLTLNY